MRNRLIFMCGSVSVVASCICTIAIGLRQSSIWLAPYSGYAPYQQSWCLPYPERLGLICGLAGAVLTGVCILVLSELTTRE